MENLDDLYGACIAPEYVYERENNQQKTAIRISKSTGHRLQNFVDHAGADAYLARYLCDGFNTLWLIDESGEILVALEEVVLEANPDIVSAPMPRGLRTSSKLGHAALAEGESARIGGELDLNPEDGKYYISNRSGRFGRTRTEAHLRNAADLFRRYGVDVTVDFLQNDLL